MLLKQDSITSQKHGSRDFWCIQEVLSSASDKAKLFAKNFSKNSNLDDSSISLLVLPSRTNLKLHNFAISPNMANKVIMNLDSSKASAPPT